MDTLIPLVTWAADWAKVWGPIKAQAPKLVNALSIFGLIVVLGGIITLLLAKRRNLKAGDNQMLLGAMVVGIMFSAPDVLLPLLLKIAEAVANGALAIGKSIFG